MWSKTVDKLRGALELLDENVAEVEMVRQQARQRLAAGEVTDAEALASTLTELDAQLDEIRRSRAALQGRLRTAERMAALEAEARAMKPEMDRLREAGDEGPRYRQLRARAEEIKAEFSRLEKDAAT